MFHTFRVTTLWLSNFFLKIFVKRFTLAFDPRFSGTVPSFDFIYLAQFNLDRGYVMYGNVIYSSHVYRQSQLPRMPSTRSAKHEATFAYRKLS